MGNLVCVSCQTCPDMKGSVTSGSLEHDDRNLLSPAVKEAPPRRTEENTSTGQCAVEKLDSNTSRVEATARDCSGQNGMPATAWELYLSPEVQATFSDPNSDASQLSDIEKVAKGIVDVNLFLTSQVILPALERYHEEQQEVDVDKINTEVVDADEVNQPSIKDLDDDAMTIRVDNGAGIYLVERVTMF